MRVAFVTLIVVGTVAWPGLAQEYAPPRDEEQPAAAEVDANGNAFVPGSLNFDPENVQVPLGGVVRWTNTDYAVPHTATEDHGLWDLGGTYGSPGPYQGFGPGESVERAFEAGTHHYYCKVHPEDMHGVVEVKPTLERVRPRRARAVWSLTAPAEGLVFDVERRREGRAWHTLLDGTNARKTKFRLGRHPKRWQLRARLRSADDAQKATDWSPVASISD